MKGCLGDSREGDNSGETQSDLDASFLPLSLSITMKRKVIACSGGCKAVVDTGVSVIKGLRTLVNNIPKLISTTPRGSKVKGHAPGSLPVSSHNKDHQGQPLTLSLIALRFTFCGQYSALYYLQHQWHQLPTASLRLHSQVEGTILKVSFQTGACRNPWAAAGRRVPSGGHVTPLQIQLSPVAGSVPPTKLIT